jgi:hypothetical protein
MATTTNYGWTTPNDTDLVKDGAAAIRTLGSSIDTTVFANASAGISKTIVDAKGDLIAATAADTVARLAVGTNGQALLANSATATGLEWATPPSGGMTLLSTTTLSGASVTISSINQTYIDLQIFIYGVTNATGNGTFRCAPNGNTGITNFQKTSTLASVDGSVNDYLMLAEGNVSSFTNNNNVYSVTIENYSSTASRKSYRLSGGYIRTDGSTPQPLLGAGWINTTSAISSLVFTNTGGNLSTGTVLIYGVK